MGFSFESVMVCLVVGLMCVSVERTNAQENLQASNETWICARSTPCAWYTYARPERTLSHYVKSPCTCPPEKQCVQVGDDISISAYVFYCRAEGEQEIMATTPRRSNRTRTCASSNPCAWETYVPFGRAPLTRIESPCTCPPANQCVQTEDNLSNATLIFYCRPVVELQFTMPSLSERNETSVCSRSTPCAWEIYVRPGRTFSSYEPSPCTCPLEKQCIRIRDNLSLSAFVFYCRDANETEIPFL